MNYSLICVHSILNLIKENMTQVTKVTKPDKKVGAPTVPSAVIRGSNEF
jgi:hypothetical protein